MANTNIQSPIPLKGRGFVQKPKGNYEAGEFKYLVNAEICDDGIIRERRSILPCGTGLGSETLMAEPQRIIGHINTDVVVMTDTKQYAVQYNDVVEWWAPSGLTVPAGAGSYHKIIAAFRYGDTAYWLTMKYDSAGLGTYDFYLHYYALQPLTDISALTYASLTHSASLFQIGLWYPNVTNVFIWKDRLWVITEKNIYYSKATDPTTFAVPDGGFFRVPDQDITYAFPIGDTLYILTENSVSLFTYSTDINNDGYLRTIANGLGGDYGCDHKGNAYFANRNAIYTISGGNVDKVIDCDFDIYAGHQNQKLLSFADYLVLIRRDPLQIGTDTTQNSWRFRRDRSADNYNHFWINTENGAAHVVDFTDNMDITPAAVEGDLPERGYVVDAYVNPNLDVWETRRLTLLTTRYTDDTPASTNGVGAAYVMHEERSNDVFVVDYPLSSAGVVVKYKPRILIELEGFKPDGNEYLMKKFRGIVCSGKFPSWDFTINHRIDGAFYGTAQSCTDYYPEDASDPTDDANFPQMPHFSHRFPVNQRGRSISIRLETSNTETDIATSGYSIYDQLELSDIRVYWTYLQRNHEYRNPSEAMRP